MPLIVLPKTCSCRCGPCPPPPSLVLVVLCLFFLFLVITRLSYGTLVLLARPRAEGMAVEEASARLPGLPQTASRAD